jgi:tetratricopeptide (TPR) repeat protein
MGEVYRATDPRLGRDVAVKFMREGADAKRFEAEARAAGQLNHPNIVGVLDVGVHQGRPYLVTELLEGQTLRERLSRPFTADEVTDLATQIALGLKAAHARGIVHRDLKPENIFVTRDGAVKILDFGIARVESERKESTLTATGALLGTAGYMAPEQVRGLPADARADLFAFGCILYELISGRRAFQGATAMEIGAAILNAQPTPLPGGTPHLALVNACLEKDRERRPASVREVLVALGGRDPAGTVSGLHPLPARPLRAWPVVAVVAVVAGVLAFALSRSAPTPMVVGKNEGVDAGSRRGVSMMDIPLPSSSSPEALALYRKGLQEVHDGSIDEGSGLLGRAMAQDPMLGAAWLRTCVWFDRNGNACREARRLRSTLSARDQALLDAFGNRNDIGATADVDGGLAREDALLASYGDDAEVVLLAALHHPRPAGASATAAFALADRALALDPTFAAVYWVRASELAVMPSAVAFHEYEECVRVAPLSSTCVRNLSRYSATAGRCDDALRYAQRGIELEPDGKFMRNIFFDARVANGASREELDALRADWPELGSRMTDQGVSVDVNAAVQLGDFELPQPDAGVSLGTRMFLAHLAEETGNPEELKRQSSAFFAARLTAVARQDHVSTVIDGPMVALALREKLMSKAEAEQTLERSLREFVALGDVHVATELRFYVATTAEEARTALAMVDATSGELRVDLLDNSSKIAVVTHGLYLGRAALLAGDVDRAIEWLQHATSVCFASDTPVLFAQQARLELGRAYELKGDTARACATYRSISTRWTATRPRCVTADKAKARLKALHCPP